MLMRKYIYYFAYLLVFVLIAELSHGQSQREWQLIQAAENGDTKQVTSLLRAGVNANCKTPKNETPLFFAAQNGNLSEISLLLNNGADPNIAATDGTTPLISAVLAGNYKICEKLLLKGANPNAKTKDNNTAMLSAIYYGFWDIMQLLYHHKAQLSKAKFDLIHVAAYHNDTVALSFLVKNRYPLNNKDQYGNYATHYAAQENSFEAMQFLIRHGAKTDVVNNAQISPLALAIQNQNKYITNVLLSKPFDKKQKPYFKMNLYTFALANQNYDAAKKLRKKGISKKGIFKFHELTWGISSVFNFEDFYMGTTVGINEMSTNTMYQLGFYSRTTRKRIWEQQTENSFMQYAEYRAFLTAGLQKKFTLRLNSKVSFEPYAGFYYLFSPAGYRGTITNDPKAVSSYSYDAGFQLRSKQHVFRLSYQNLDFQTYKLMPHKVGFSYLYTFNLLSTRKYENSLNLL